MEIVTVNWDDPILSFDDNPDQHLTTLYPNQPPLWYGMCNVYAFFIYITYLFYLKSTSIHQAGSESPKESSAPVMLELNQVWQNV